MGIRIFMHRKRNAIKALSLIGLFIFVTSGCDEMPSQTQEAIVGRAILPEPADVPAGSRLEVILEDISRADIAAQPIAELQQDATQPFTFRLTYNNEFLNAKGRYNLRGRIIDPSGKLLWRTESQAPIPKASAEVILKLVPATTKTSLTQDLFYQCEQLSLLVKIDGDNASLFIGERVLALHKMASASGVHFQSEEADFWSKGDEAILSLAGESRRYCSMQPLAISLAILVDMPSLPWPTSNPFA